MNNTRKKKETKIEPINLEHEPFAASSSHTEDILAIKINELIAAHNSTIEEEKCINCGGVLLTKEMYEKKLPVTCECPASQETKESWADEFDFVDKLDRYQVINKAASLIRSERAAVVEESIKALSEIGTGIGHYDELEEDCYYGGLADAIEVLKNLKN